VPTFGTGRSALKKRTIWSNLVLFVKRHLEAMPIALIILMMPSRDVKTVMVVTELLTASPDPVLWVVQIKSVGSPSKNLGHEPH
jgi:hypothetical protein